MASATTTPRPRRHTMDDLFAPVAPTLVWCACCAENDCECQATDVVRTAWGYTCACCTRTECDCPAAE